MGAAVTKAVRITFSALLAVHLAGLTVSAMAVYRLGYAKGRASAFNTYDKGGAMAAPQQRGVEVGVDPDNNKVVMGVPTANGGFDYIGLEVWGAVELAYLLLSKAHTARANEQEQAAKATSKLIVTRPKLFIP